MEDLDSILSLERWLDGDYCSRTGTGSGRLHGRDLISFAIAKLEKSFGPVLEIECRWNRPSSGLVSIAVGKHPHSSFCGTCSTTAGELQFHAVCSEGQAQPVRRVDAVTRVPCKVSTAAAVHLLCSADNLAVCVAMRGHCTNINEKSMYVHEAHRFDCAKAFLGIGEVPVAEIVGERIFKERTFLTVRCRRNQIETSYLVSYAKISAP